MFCKFANSIQITAIFITVVSSAVLDHDTTNFAIKFHKCSGKKFLRLKNMFLEIEELAKHSIVHGSQFIDYLTQYAAF